MTHVQEPSDVRLVAVLFPPVLAAVLLLAGLGGARMWAPHETAVLRAALAEDPAASQAPGASPLTGLLTSASVALLGGGEVGARLPGALLGWLAVLLVHLTLIVLGNPRIAAFGTLAFASSAVCLFHGRQLTGDAPLLLAQVAATAGLSLVAYAPGRRAVPAGVVLAAGGVLAGVAEAGLLVGGVLPAGTVLAALALTGDLSGLFRPGERVPPPRRAVTAAVTATFAVSALGGYLVVLLSGMPDVRVVTGGLAAAPAAWPGFDGPLERLAYGWFPWSVVAPLAFLLLSRRDREAPPDPLPALAAAGLAVGYLVQVADTSVRGPGPLFLALPMAAAVGLALHRLETSRSQAVLATVLVLVFAAVLIRDFAQAPEAILMAHGFEGIEVPGDFAPVVPAALAALPFAVMIAVLGLLPDRAPAGGGGRLAWRGYRGSALALVAAVVWGGFIALVLVPDLSGDPAFGRTIEDRAGVPAGGDPRSASGEVEKKRGGDEQRSAEAR